LIIPGDNHIICADAYNGARLWDVNISNFSRVAILRDAGCVAVDEDYVYVAVEDDCLKIDLDTGQIVDTYHPPTGNSDWGYVGIDGNLLFGSEQIVGASLITPDYYNRGVYGNDFSRGDDRPTVTSRVLFCRDRNIGSLLWTYDDSNGLGSNEFVIANPTICVGGDGVYFFESYDTNSVTDADGCVIPLTFCNGNNEYLVKLDKNTGELLWRQQHNLPFENIMYLSYANGIHGKQDKHPMIVGDTIYHRYGTYNLQTGAPVSFSFTLSSKCADCSASATHIFGRQGDYGFRGGVGIYNLSVGGSGSPLCSAARPGCYISIIPAGGVIMMPAYSNGCTCAYTLLTSIAWIPQ